MPCARSLLLLLILVVFTAKLGVSESTTADSDRDRDEGQTYIVYLGHLPTSDASEFEDGLSAIEFAHQDLLNQVLDDSSSASERILRSYKRSLNGFAARLTEQEAHELSGMDGVVSVFPSKTHRLLTTRSWDFLGLPQTPPQELPLQGEVIVGMLDTGIWPNSPSFSDDGFGPPPSRWKGACQNITCNNKIIGARVYDHRQGSISGLSPLDEVGHGSHTASTVAGRAVANVSFDGLAAGVARGAVPGARLAIYKVCVGVFCSDADILAGFDDAIADGVDVISFSIGGMFPMQYFQSAQAIGSFHAMRRGVLTSASAGNSGQFGGRVCNVAPWMLSVAASSIDRRFDRLILGDGQTIEGTSINTTFPTVANATLAFPPGGSCDPDNLGGGSYKGKILLCPSPNNASSNGQLLADAAAIALVTPSPYVVSELPDLPALMQSCGYHTQNRDGQSTRPGTRPVFFSGPEPDHPWDLEATPMNTPANANSTAFKYGAGQLNPLKAHDPGLVYDASESDYVAMLCAQGYNATQLALITGSNTTICPGGSTVGSPSDLNYPSMAGRVDPGKNFTVSFPRTVTNVGAASDAYDVNIIVPIEAAEGIVIDVSPSKLEFSAQNQKISFTVTVSGMAPLDGLLHSAAVVWYNDKHEVRSPVVLYTEVDS
ncbi:hypothetical protein HU200_015982 [Digitaria exilis]|uniref:Cucumisin n=1 Tax=Digitaria exilis TaxID=1010633 RepID=A0A835KK98_9POAL|nr:hypothetical protein HU200_015982 [Digitaria exilis]